MSMLLQNPLAQLYLGAGAMGGFGVNEGEGIANFLRRQRQQQALAAQAALPPQPDAQALASVAPDAQADDRQKPGADDTPPPDPGNDQGMPDWERNMAGRYNVARRLATNNLFNQAGRLGMDPMQFAGQVPGAMDIIDRKPYDDRNLRETIQRQTLTNRLETEPQGERWKKLLAARQGPAMPSIPDRAPPSPEEAAAMLARAGQTKLSGSGADQRPGPNADANRMALQRKNALRARMKGVLRPQADAALVAEGILPPMPQGQGQAGGSNVAMLRQQFDSGMLAGVPVETLQQMLVAAQHMDMQQALQNATNQFAAGRQDKELAATRAEKEAERKFQAERDQARNKIDQDRNDIAREGMGVKDPDKKIAADIVRNNAIEEGAIPDVPPEPPEGIRDTGAGGLPKRSAGLTLALQKGKRMRAANGGQVPLDQLLNLLGNSNLSDEDTQQLARELNLNVDSARQYGEQNLSTSLSPVQRMIGGALGLALGGPQASAGVLSRLDPGLMAREQRRLKLRGILQQLLGG